MLIGMALANNAKLEHAKGTKFIKEIVVPGIISTSTGKAKKASVQFLKEVLRA